ncbi:MAG: 4'-phosphopantetheinyl transferase superfamily protein [Pseudomonadota bacterium]|nr:4'-phosphopantetheinyl transferase superfamily protein [Pseudomonadota bacterium]
MAFKIYHQQCTQADRKAFYLRSVEQSLKKKVIIQKNDVGKPYLACQSAFISITHKAQETVVAVSDQPIGIDIETLNQHVNTLKLAERFFCAAEYEYLLSLDKDACMHAFIHFWTGKEAITKLKGLGVPSSLKRIELDPYNGFKPMNDDINIEFQAINDHYLLAIAMFSEIDNHTS